MIQAMDSDAWGPLSIDAATLAKKLAEASRSVYAASTAAQYRSAGGYLVSSAWAEMLGGLTQVIDALIAELDAEHMTGSRGTSAPSIPVLTLEREVAIRERAGKAPGWFLADPDAASAVGTLADDVSILLDEVARLRAASSPVPVPQDGE